MLRNLLISLFGILVVPQLAFATTDTFYPSADASVGCGTECGITSWATLRSLANGDPSETNNTDTTLIGTAGKSGSNYINIRAPLFFDTSTLPDNAIIDSADFTITQDAMGGSCAGGRSFTIVPSSSTGTTSIQLYDYDSLSYTELVTARHSRDDWSNGTSQTFTFNSTGLSNISLTGTTRFMMIDATKDFDNSAPSDYCYSIFRTSEYTGTTSDPVMTVTYHLPSSSSSSAASSSSSSVSFGTGTTVPIGRIECSTLEASGSGSICTVWEASIYTDALDYDLSKQTIFLWHLFEWLSAFVVVGLGLFYTIRYGIYLVWPPRRRTQTVIVREKGD